ncbi:MAG: hypothetical protein EA353_04955 [Puniceicoccaceae bacterium]|nr:MAG: hypothetical protein EA353_04955 [Puniceicoccaceae bacterium]
MPTTASATTATSSRSSPRSFSTTILFIDDSNDGPVTLVDASKLGKKVKDGKNQKTSKSL